ncbi:SseB family protein [Streptomyces roseofulvus]|uniref:SseB family protein n=2 Tax=Streptomyces TaxID=1883 RepID=A0ABU4K4W1_9ACTN|nr:SseB family protein [Streptomyces roseolus]MDX2292796.1 SseB family protein [Streptomyces roseolus]
MNDHGEKTTGPQQHSRIADLTYSAPPPADQVPAPPREATDPEAAARREFARLLGEFRRTAVLVPFDELGSLWTAEYGGVRWICAFSDEEALARFAEARGEAAREWTYRTVLGARLLDAMVPMLPGPGGVALDAGSAGGMVFPPVAGIVPDEVAVDLAEAGGTGEQ